MNLKFNKDKEIEYVNNLESNLQFIEDYFNIQLYPKYIKEKLNIDTFEANCVFDGTLCIALNSNYDILLYEGYIDISVNNIGNGCTVDFEFDKNYSYPYGSIQNIVDSMKSGKVSTVISRYTFKTEDDIIPDPVTIKEIENYRKRSTFDKLVHEIAKASYTYRTEVREVSTPIYESELGTVLKVTPYYDYNTINRFVLNTGHLMYFDMNEDIFKLLIELVNPKTLLDKIRFYQSVGKSFKLYSPAFGYFESDEFEIKNGVIYEGETEAEYIHLNPSYLLDIEEESFGIDRMCSDNGTIVFDKFGYLITNPNEGQSPYMASPEVILEIR